MESMNAMLLYRTGIITKDSTPLELTRVPLPTPSAGELLIRIKACGVCHTELDEIEGRTPPSKFPIIPGHEVIGEVIKTGSGVTDFSIGDRVGVGWIYSSSGGPEENLSEEFKATGRDADGGYAEYMVVQAKYTVPVPEKLGDIQAAPLLCAGAVGYRALKLTGLANRQILGFMGFGGSAHLTIQIARLLYPGSRLYVFAREEGSRKFARSLGAHWAGSIEESPPDLCHAIIDTTPAWNPVIKALSCLRPGGRLVINAIRKEDCDRELLAGISYADHLWMEKEIKTVANVTADDIRSLLPLAVRAEIEPRTRTYPLKAANQALHDLKFTSVRGSLVLVP